MSDEGYLRCLADRVAGMEWSPIQAERTMCLALVGGSE